MGPLPSLPSALLCCLQVSAAQADAERWRSYAEAAEAGQARPARPSLGRTASQAVSFRRGVWARQTHAMQLGAMAVLSLHSCAELLPPWEQFGHQASSPA